MAKKQNKVVIVHKNVAFHGQKINLPEEGNVVIGANGEVEVSEEVAELLVNGSPSWMYPESNEDEEVEEEDEEVEEEDEDEEDTEEDTEEDEESDEDEEDEEEDSDEEDLTAEDGIEILSTYTAAKLKVAAVKEMNITKEDMRDCKTKQDLLDFIHDNWDHIPSEFKQKIA